MPTAIDVRANENAEYTNTVINKAADIIEEMAATKQDWSAVTALEQAGREFRNRNGHGELHFTVQAVINTLNRHFAAAEEEHNKQSQSPLEARAPGCSAETVATTLREAAPKVAKYVHGSWRSIVKNMDHQNRTDAARNGSTSHHRRRHQESGQGNGGKAGKPWSFAQPRFHDHPESDHPESQNAPRKAPERWETIKHYLPQAGLLVIGTLLGAAFSSIVLHTEIEESLATNEAEIDANKAQIDRLWDAHRISDVTTESGE